MELLCRVNLTNVYVQRTEVPYCRAALVPIVKVYLCEGVALRPHGFNTFYCFSLIYVYVSDAVLAGPLQSFLNHASERSLPTAASTHKSRAARRGVPLTDNETRLVLLV